MDGQMWLPAVMAVGGYLVGSIPFGVIVSKALGAPDPRTAGSRNIGFTNVLRVSGKMAGTLTLLGDAGKGWLVAWLATQTFESETPILVVTMAPVVGHLYSAFLAFKGGKGVATAMGAVAGVVWPVGLAMLGLWVLGAGITRISSVGALAAFTGLPILGVTFGRSWQFLVFAVLVSGLILVRHRGNIVRLWEGREPRMGSGKPRESGGSVK